MDTRTIRRTKVALPSLDEPGLALSDVTSLEDMHGRVTGFRYADAKVRELDLAGAQLVEGRVSGCTAERTRLDAVRADSVEFSCCELPALSWTGSKLSRIVFRECRLMGAALEGLALDNVLFEKCKLDYATFARVRALGPVIFSGCSLREAAFIGSDLRAALFDDCDLRLTEFGDGTYRGLDLRGNDLSAVRGVSALKQVIIDRVQMPQLADALAGELDVTFGADLDDV